MRALWMIALANVLGGLSYPMQKIAVAGLPPATVCLLRNAVSIVCMLLWMRHSGARMGPLRARDWLRLSLVGVLGYGLPLWLGIAGVERAPASNGALLILLEPVSILVLSRLLLDEHIRATQYAGVGLGLLGALVIALEGAQLSDLFAGEYLVGNALLLASAVLWGLYTPLAKPLADKHPSVPLTYWPMVLSLSLLVPASALEHERWAWSHALPVALVMTLLLGLFVTFVGTVLWVASLRELKASVVAGFLCLQPIAGVFASSVFLGEAISTSAIFGGGIIAAGLLLVSVGARAQRG